MRIFNKASDLLDYEFDTDIFLIEPWLPARSTVVLFGKPSVGKSPVAWAMAEAVQCGGKVLGVQAQQGNALVLEFDMPDVLVYTRLKNSGYKPNFTLAFDSNRVDSLQLQDDSMCNGRHRELRSVLQDLHRTYDPTLVVIDALREVVRGDINGTGIADRVYDAWHSLFPNATILFLHHESKDHYDFAGKAVGDPMEKAKGSMEFVDIAQVSLRLTATPKGLYLIMVKSQASAKPPPRAIRLVNGLLKDGG